MYIGICKNICIAWMYWLDHVITIVTTMTIVEQSVVVSSFAVGVQSHWSLWIFFLITNTKKLQLSCIHVIYLCGLLASTIFFSSDISLERFKLALKLWVRQHSIFVSFDFHASCVRSVSVRFPLRGRLIRDVRVILIIEESNVCSWKWICEEIQMGMGCVGHDGDKKLDE